MEFDIVSFEKGDVVGVGWESMIREGVGVFYFNDIFIVFIRMGEDVKLELLWEYFKVGDEEIREIWVV